MRWVSLAALVACAAVLAGCRPFADNSPWNTPIGSSPSIDPNSGSMVSKLAGSTAIADLYDYGTPVYFADANTPKRTVDCTQPWGTCKLEQQPVPIPTGAKPAPGSDGQMVVVDTSNGNVWEYWQYAGDYAHTSWGDMVPWTGQGTGSTAVGAGTSRLAGLITAAEIQNGDIPHALAFSTSYCDSSYRYPATKSDGHAGGGIPEGSRWQLDPGFDVDSVPGITPAERAIGHALQTYGAYAIDCGGAAFALQFENPRAEGRADPYPAAGLGSDYASLPHLPLSRLRVVT